MIFGFFVLYFIKKKKTYLIFNHCPDFYFFFSTIFESITRKREGAKTTALNKVEMGEM